MHYNGDNSLIQQMPIVMLKQWASTSPSVNDDLALMEDIMQNGITEPLILGVGVYSRKIRLDTGNHRIYLAPKLGFTHLPVIAHVGNYCNFNPHNGDHSYNCPYITRKKEWLDADYFCKPNEILDILEIMKAL